MESNEQIKTVNSWLKEMSNVLGVALSLDEEGVCTFQIGQDTIIGIEVSMDYPMVHIYSPLISLPSDNQPLATLMAFRALEMNAFQALTRGGAIAIAPGGGPLFFCYSIPIEGTDLEKFNQILGGIYEILPEIKQVLLETDDIKTPLPKLTENRGFLKV
jgi:hypothetical protein